MNSRVFYFLLIISFAACKSPKIQNRNYFSAQMPDSSHTRLWQDYEIRIQKRDKVSISVNALNPASAQIFNLSSGATGTGTQSQGQGYTVDENGNILFPQLGFIHIEGLTRNQVRDTLLNRLSVFLKDPVVSVDFLNMKVTILGEVTTQGIQELNAEKITLLQALGEAGDITETGRRDSIMVIREINNQRQFGYVNLLSNEAFKSPYFVLQQNDVVYVPMVKDKAYREEKRDDNFVQKSIPYITALTSLTSLIWLIYTLIK